MFPLIVTYCHVLGLDYSCLALFYRVLFCLVLFCFVLSCLVLSCRVLSLSLSWVVVSCLFLSCLVLSCLVLSYLVLSCLVLSRHIASCTNSSRIFYFPQLYEQFVNPCSFSFIFNYPQLYEQSVNSSLVFRRDQQLVLLFLWITFINGTYPKTHIQVLPFHS